MKATTKTQAERIAKAGAKKMNAETHTIKGSSIKSLIGKQFTITNNESGERYTTSIDPKKTYCSCPFFQENKEFGVCKHIEYAKEDVAWEAARIEEYELSGR